MHNAHPTGAIDRASRAFRESPTPLLRRVGCGYTQGVQRTQPARLRFLPREIGYPIKVFDRYRYLVVEVGPVEGQLRCLIEVRSFWHRFQTEKRAGYESAAWILKKSQGMRPIMGFAAVCTDEYIGVEEGENHQPRLSRDAPPVGDFVQDLFARKKFAAPSFIFLSKLSHPVSGL